MHANEQLRHGHRTDEDVLHRTKPRGPPAARTARTPQTPRCPQSRPWVAFQGEGSPQGAQVLKKCFCLFAKFGQALQKEFKSRTFNGEVGPAGLILATTRSPRSNSTVMPSEYTRCTSSEKWRWASSRPIRSMVVVLPRPLAKVLPRLSLPIIRLRELYTKGFSGKLRQRLEPFPHDQYQTPLILPNMPRAASQDGLVPFPVGDFRPVSGWEGEAPAEPFTHFTGNTRLGGSLALPDLPSIPHQERGTNQLETALAAGERSRHKVGQVLELVSG